MLTFSFPLVNGTYVEDLKDDFEARSPWWRVIQLLHETIVQDSKDAERWAKALRLMVHRGADPNARHYIFVCRERMVRYRFSAMLVLHLEFIGLPQDYHTCRGHWGLLPFSGRDYDDIRSIVEYYDVAESYLK
jgi:hypothetical protein